jgi:hypothetical protein
MGGAISTKYFVYDLWVDIANIASSLFIYGIFKKIKVDTYPGYVITINLMDRIR